VLGVVRGAWTTGWAERGRSERWRGEGATMGLGRDGVPTNGEGGRQGVVGREREREISSQWAGEIGRGEGGEMA